MKFLLTILFISLLLIGACGQTGDLVLPPEMTEKKDDKPANKQAPR